MSRMRIVVEVPDIEEAVSFYTRALGTAVASRGRDSAEILVEDPGLRLVLVPGSTGAVRSLGIEVGTAGELDAVARRLRTANIHFDGGEDATCCDDYLTDIWMKDPGGVSWEVVMPVGDGVDAAACRSACCAS